MRSPSFGNRVCPCARRLRCLEPLCREQRGLLRGAQSGGFGAAPGPLAMAEGPEGITPELWPKGFREGFSWGAGNCWGGLGRCNGSCNGRVVVSSLQSVFCNVGFVRLTQGSSFLP